MRRRAGIAWEGRPLKNLLRAPDRPKSSPRLSPRPRPRPSPSGTRAWRKSRFNTGGQQGTVSNIHSRQTLCTISPDPTSPYLPSRITSFQDTWPKMEKWFSGKQSILVRINAELEEGELFRRVEAVLFKRLTQPENGTMFTL